MRQFSCQTLVDEVYGGRNALRKTKSRMGLFYLASPRRFESWSTVGKALSSLIPVKNLGLTSPSHEILSRFYKILAEKNNRRLAKVTVKTTAENWFQSVICENTNRKFLRSVWIGHANFDFYFPNVTGLPGNRRMKGLAVEIDGPVHYRSAKMSKDQDKYEALHDLGIGLAVVQNQRVKKYTTHDLVADLKLAQRLDSRAIKRQDYKIFALTVSHYATAGEFGNLLGLPSKAVEVAEMVISILEEKGELV